MGTVRGVMCHHTAGPKNGIMPSLGVVTDGRPGLAGPLSQLCLGRDGTYFVVAAGLAFHAGAGQWQGITSGNSSFIGIEAENTGIGRATHYKYFPDVESIFSALHQRHIGHHFEHLNEAGQGGAAINRLKGRAHRLRPHPKRTPTTITTSYTAASWKSCSTTIHRWTSTT